MSAFVLVVALGCLLASVLFFVAARSARAEACGFYREAHQCLRDARALYGVGVGKGVIYCDGAEFAVTSISHDFESGARFLTAETKATFVAARTVRGEDA